MPRKTDSIPIKDRVLDGRIKLLDCQREMMPIIRETHGLSYNQLARRYGVSKRLAIFICKPETYAKSREQRREKGQKYYDKEYHTAAIQKHRLKKKELFKK